MNGRISPDSCELTTAASAGAPNRITRTCLVVVLLIAAAFRLWNLGANEFGNLYYAATVRSMATSWHNFFYASFDPAGFLSVDKPPVAFWFQVLSVKLLGYTGFALHLPQALEGIFSVVVVYLLTRRVAGKWGGVLASLAMAMTPASVAIDRSNLPDSCLLFTLLVAAAVLLRATETGRWTWLLLSTALVGLAFNVKLTAAYLVLPTFYLVYWLGSPVVRSVRLAQLGAATAVLFAVSLSWATIVDLTPARSRPYVGDTRNNSVLGLAFHLQGMQRVTGEAKERPGPPPFGGVPGPFGEPFTGHGGHPGLFRLANRDLAGHITWLLPFAVVGLVAISRASRFTLPLSRLHQSVLLWSGWFATYAVAFSFSKSPIHPYYLCLLAPPSAALVGIGATVLWDAYKMSGWRSFGLVAALTVTAFWQAWTLTYRADPMRWLLPLVLLGAGASVIGLLAARTLRQQPAIARRLGTTSAALGLASLLICPAAWSATPVIAAGGRMVPVADPILLARHDSPREAEDDWRDTRMLVEFLCANRKNERFLLVVPDIHLASPIIIDTGANVMAYGGFSGGDPILTVQQFAEMIEAGAFRFVLLTSRPPPGGAHPGRRDAIAAWVREYGSEVSSDRWRAGNAWGKDLGPPPSPWGETSEMLRQLFRGPDCRLYDCGGWPILAPARVGSR